MKLNRLSIIACLALAYLSLSEASTHRNKRALRIFSKAPEGEMYKGWNLPKHADNALQGGTIGLEYDAKRLAGPVGSVWRRIRKFLSRRKDWRDEQDWKEDEKEDKKDEKEGRDWGEDDPMEDLVINGIDPRGKPDTMRVGEWEKNEEELY